MPRPADPSINEQFANLAAGDALAAQLHLRINLDLEAHLASKFGEHRNIARGFVAEAEIKAFVYLARVELLFQDALGELPWCHQRKIAPEGEKQNGVDAGRFQESQFFGSRAEQLQP